MGDDFYKEYRGYVFAVSWKFTQNRFDAEDVVQEVFMVYMRKQPTFYNRKAMQSWLCNVARFEARKIKAKQSPFVNIEGMEIAIEYAPKDMETRDTGRINQRTVGFVSTLAQRLTSQFA